MLQNNYNLRKYQGNTKELLYTEGNLKDMITKGTA